MERSTAFQAFTPFRHTGLGFYNHAPDLSSTWALSYFRTGQDQFGSSLSTNGGHGLAGRLTRVNGWEESAGTSYRHWGLGYYLNAPPRDVARFRSIPEMFVGEFAPGGVGTSGQPVPGVINGTPFFVDTRPIADVNLINTYGCESLWVHGPWSLQSEAMVAVVDRQGPGTPAFWGGYTQFGYFLTGEHRPYDRVAGAVDRVIPNDNFRAGQGRGAWELTGRLSYIDLTSSGIEGGELTNMTCGVNWYLNPHCKWVFNYIHAWGNSPDLSAPAAPGLLSTNTDIFAVRCQIDF
jgi:phosphate-selective porin OprO/OprP